MRTLEEVGGPGLLAMLALFRELVWLTLKRGKISDYFGSKLLALFSGCKKLIGFTRKNISVKITEVDTANFVEASMTKITITDIFTTFTPPADLTSSQITVWGLNSTSTPYKKQPVMAGIRYQPCPAWPEPDCQQFITSSLIFSECSKQDLLWAEMLVSYLSLLHKDHNITAELGFYFLLHTKSELKTWARLTQPQLSQGQAREGDWPAAASQTQPARATQGLVWRLVPGPK